MFLPNKLTAAPPNNRRKLSSTKPHDDIARAATYSLHISGIIIIGIAVKSLIRSQAATLPFLIERMERHPLGSQAFMPLHQRPFPVIVAPAGDDPDIQTIRGFISSGGQGINFHKGVWHHYQISLNGICDYLVIDRIGPNFNCEEWVLDRKLVIS